MFLLWLFWNVGGTRTVTERILWVVIWFDVVLELNTGSVKLNGNLGSFNWLTKLGKIG